MLYTHMGLLRQRRLARSYDCARGFWSTAGEGAITWGQWVELRKPRLIQVFLSGTAMCLAMHSVNLRNRGDEIEAELTEQLGASAAAREAILWQAPALACEMGLPASEEAKFRAALHALDAQVSTSIGKPAMTAAETRPAATPANSAPLKQQAVW